jgi:hypothetical protein
MREKIQNLLLSWGEYNKKKFSIPYIYSVNKGDQILIYFGANHSNEPSHPQYERLEEEWDKFLSHSVDKIAIGEGRRARPYLPGKEESISEYGEQGYLRYLADASHISLSYPDPSEPDVWNALLGTYSKDELFFHDVMQFAHQWKRENKQIDFRDYLGPYLENYRKNSGWIEYDFSLSHAKAISEGLIGKQFDEHDMETFYKLINPSVFKTSFNQLSRDIDVYRDTAVVEEILRNWNQGNSIFVVFGSGHAVIQERAIKALVN